MKGRGFWQRVRFAFAGLGHALRQEASFRMQLLAACLVLGAVAWLRPPLLWQALLAAMVVLVLAAELVNTAIEEILDGLHPEQAVFVARAKDCAAAAVLILSIGAVVVFLLMVMDLWNGGWRP